jgi:hypothetical protein
MKEENHSFMKSRYLIYLYRLATGLAILLFLLLVITGQ